MVQFGGPPAVNETPALLTSKPSLPYHATFRSVMVSR